MIRWLGLICGASAALILCEFGVRPFFGEVHTPRMITVRQYEEGMATAHYVRNDPQDYNWRLTGNAAIEGAPEVLIVGDSYVLARQVSDDATMGALIERRSRAEGRPINVRQYGIPGGSAAGYAAAARALLARWNPAWVIVVLPSNDLTEQAFDLGSWRMRLGSGDSVEMYQVLQPPLRRPTVAYRIFNRVKRHSTLLDLLALRWNQLHRPQRPQHPGGIDESERVAKVPQASVSLLAQAYGDRLLILHLPEISRSNSRRITPAEVRLEAACLEAGIPYVSAREVLIRARDRFVLSRGFWNTTPGDGHLNETGHRLVAGALWQLLEKARHGVQMRKST